MTSIDRLFRDVEPARRRQIENLDTSAARSAVIGAFERQHRQPAARTWMLLAAACATCGVVLYVLFGHAEDARSISVRAESSSPSPTTVSTSNTATIAPSPPPLTTNAQRDETPPISIPTTTAKQAPAIAPVERKISATWRTALREGRGGDAIDVLTAQLGSKTDPTVLDANAEELLQLAEAAMMKREDELANGLLRTLLTGFESSKEAAVAHYYVGRNAASAGRRQEAIVAFTIFLSKQPQSALAREAHGRLLELLLAEGRDKEAASTARAYLDRFPNGPHATIARRTLE